MAPSRSADPQFTPVETELLVDVADAAIVDGLLGQPPFAPPMVELPAALRERRGVFVTLTVDGELNGCIGSVIGVEALGHGTARYAWSAAFADPRLPSLHRADYERLLIEISVLSPLAAMPAGSRQAVLDELRPGVDGLLIAAGDRHGVFLPAVWDQLSDAVTFLARLEDKAGLSARSWPAGMRAWRFTAEKITRRAGEQPRAA